MSVGIEVVTTFTGAAIQAAIDKIAIDTGNGGGVVLLPAGAYDVSTTITMRPKITLQGSGKQTTTLRALADITVLDVIGTASANASGGLGNHIASPIVCDLAIDGGNNPAWSTNPMVRCYYMHTAEFNSVNFNNKYGIQVLIGAECWDCTWRECRWNGGGGINQSLPAMLVQSADGAVFPAFGSSTDATNDQRFYHCTWEGFRDGAFWTANPSGANPVEGLYFFGCKADQNQSALGPWFKIDRVIGSYIRDFDSSSYIGGSAYLGTPYAMFVYTNCYPGLISNHKHYQNSAHNSNLYTFDGTVGVGNRFITLDGISVQQAGSGGGSFSTSVLKFVGTVNQNYWFSGLDTVSYGVANSLSVKPLFSGSLPIQKPISIRAKTSSFSDTDFGPQEPGIPTGLAEIAGVDTTNNRLYVRYTDGTYHYATLT